LRHVVHARLEVGDRPERRMLGHVADPLAVDPDLASVAQPGAVFFPGSDHPLSPSLHRDLVQISEARSWKASGADASPRNSGRWWGMSTLFDDLQQQIAKRQVLAVTGAGVSIAATDAGTPSCAGLYAEGQMRNFRLPNHE